MTNLDELRRLESQATPGPLRIADAPPGTTQIHLLGRDLLPIVVITPLRAADGQVLVAARNALPALLDEVERLRAVAEAGRELLIAEQARIGAASKRYTVEGEQAYRAASASWNEADRKWRAALAGLEAER